MNYELAKQLKDAGFPQNPNNGTISLLNEDGTTRKDNLDISAKVSTLSELILEVYKHCHEVRLEALKDNPGVWAAATCWGNGREDDWQTADTPEGALAKLWLTLQ